jgi:hypothetical protein
MVHRLAMVRAGGGTGRIGVNRRQRPEGEVMSARWLARAAFLLVLAAADMIGFAGLASLAMVAVGAAGACLVPGGYLFLARRGVLRWPALAVVVLAAVTVLVIFTRHRLLWVALVAVALIVLAADAGRRALTPAAADPGMPAWEVPPPRHAFLIMNPRSGGGKVARFGLRTRPRRSGPSWRCWKAPAPRMWRRWPGRRWPTARTCSGWPGVTGRRRWWPGSLPSMTCRSW